MRKYQQSPDSEDLQARLPRQQTEHSHPVLARQKQLGNQQVLRQLNLQRSAPLYLRSALNGTTSSLQRRSEIEEFRRANPDETLLQQRAALSEAPLKSNLPPTQAVRRMGREPSGRERDLEQVQIGDSEFVMEVCRFFFPNNPPTQVNEQLKEVAANMLWSATQKSRALDYVPRPPGNRPSPTWLVTQGVKAAWRAAQDEGLYEIARVSTALQYRSQYELALMGL